MCGIAGLLGIPPDIARRAAPRMLAAMQHRGPDDRGTEWVRAGGSAAGSTNGSAASPDAVLLHARLAILDLSPAGHQPMADKPSDANVPPNWMVFNGEVFNYQDLCGDLAGAGWACHTRCDTEVILNAYRVWGEDAVQRMRGMFAWCLLDAARGTAWLCRDRLGIKPLYLFRPGGGGLLFASELRTLLAAGPELVPGKVRPAALESFLAQGAVFGLDGIIEGVELLPPGHSMTVDWSGRPLRSVAYWQIPFSPDAGNSGLGVAHGHTGVAHADPAATAAELGATLRDAVRLRLISDVPLGLFLSGGVDSSAIATLATEVAGTRVRTICIGFDDPAADEAAAAAEVAAALGTDHHTVRLAGADILRDLPAALAAVDQPTVDGFNTYFVSRAARRDGLTVALSGLGGDELFAGYSSFHYVPRAYQIQKRLRWLGRGRGPLGRLARLAQLFNGFNGRGAVKAEEMFRREPSLLQMYLLRRELFLPAERRMLLPLPPQCHEDCGLADALLGPVADRAAGLDPVNQVSLFELQLYMRHMLLRDGDAFSMAHGLEVRFPLLGHKLVEQVAAMPGRAKLPRPHSKALFTEAVGARLPSSSYTRPKRGFTFPWDTWLRGPLRGWASDLLSESSVWSDLGLDAAAPARLWRRFGEGDSRVAALQILALVVLRDFATRHRLSV